MFTLLRGTDTDANNVKLVGNYELGILKIGIYESTFSYFFTLAQAYWSRVGHFPRVDREYFI